MKNTIKNISSFVFRARWRILVVLSPALIVAVLLAVQTNLHLSNYIPFYNDEWGWYKTVQAIVADGMPLGYYGYNGTHALHGTFGAWSIASFLPFALFGKLFGWHLYSPLLANLTFLCGANLAFILFAKPKNKDLKYLFLVNLLNFSLITASITAMAECSRASISIVLCGIFLRLMRGESKAFFRYVFTPLALIVAIQIFVPFLILVPVYFWILFKNKWWLTIPASLAACGAMAAIFFLLVHYTNAPFYEPAQTDLILDTLKAGGVIQAVRFAFQLLIQNLQSIDVPHLLPALSDFSAMFVMAFWILFFFILFSMIHKWKKTDKEEKQTQWLILYLLGGYIAAYCVLYDSVVSRVARGLYVIIAFLLFFSCVQKNKNFVKVFLAVSCVFLFSSNAKFVEIAKLRTSSVETLTTYQTYKTEVDQVMNISRDNKRWDNTIAVYLNPTKALYCMPDSAGYNFMVDEGDGKNTGRARYALVNKQGIKKERVNATRNALEKKNYRSLLENDLFLLMERADT